MLTLAALLMMGTLKSAGDTPPEVLPSPRPQFTITNLTPVALEVIHHSSAYSINNKGQIVGMAGGQAFLWQAGQLGFLGKPWNSKVSMAFQINDAGQIAGSAFFDDYARRFLWQNGNFQPLGPVRAHTGIPQLNNKGLVAATNQENPDMQAFVWKNGIAREINLAAVTGVNDKGQVVGFQWRRHAKGTRKGETAGVRAAVWKRGKVTILSDKNSSADAINNRGDIVVQENHRFFLLSGNKRTELGTPEGKIAEGKLTITAMNGRRQIVGWAKLPDNKIYAVLWQDGRWHDLNSLISANSGWVLTFALDIDEIGQIVGQGSLPGVNRAFLLTPVVENSPSPQSR